MSVICGFCDSPRGVHIIAREIRIAKILDVAGMRIFCIGNPVTLVAQVCGKLSSESM